MAHLILPNGKGHGWKPDTPDYRDRMFKQAGKPTLAIGDKVMLKPELIPPVRDQGDLGSCTGFGTTGALMYSMRGVRKKETSLSPLFAYYQGRVLETTVKEDAGAEIRDVVKAAANLGIATEKSWPYEVRKFSRTPSKTAVTTAGRHQVSRYYRCDGIEDIVHAIATGLPVVGGFSCFSNLSEANDSGHVPLPAGRLEGGHAVWFFAANLNDRVLTFQNSWGDWGDDGNGYLPFEYVLRGWADDFWAIEHE